MLPKELTIVSPLSKVLAAVLFVSLPFIGFFLGMQYEQTFDQTKESEITNNIKINHPTSTPITIPTVDPSITANWKTYTSTKYGFSIAYPNSWDFKDKLSKDTEYETIISFGLRNSQGTVQEEVGILVYKSNLDLNQFIDTVMCLEPGHCASSKKAVDINVGNTVAKKVVNLPGPISPEVTLIKKNPYILRFQIVIFATAGKENEVVKRKEILDQILSTFKFTDQMQVTPTGTAEGKFCGGIAGNPCPQGYECKLDGTHPDAGGKCVKL